MLKPKYNPTKLIIINRITPRIMLMKSFLTTFPIFIVPPFHTRFVPAYKNILIMSVKYSAKNKKGLYSLEE